MAKAVLCGEYSMLFIFRLSMKGINTAGLRQHSCRALHQALSAPSAAKLRGIDPCFDCARSAMSEQARPRLSLRLSIIFFALILSGADILSAQPAGPVTELRFGTWVPGQLQEGEEQWFSIRPSEAGLVVVETDGDTDTYLEAYDDSGRLLAEDDDGKNAEDLDYNARLEITAAADRTYLIKLRCSDGAESGPYRIRVSFKAIPLDAEQRIRSSLY